MAGSSRVERLGTEKIGKLLLEMSSQTTFSLLVYAVYSITDTYFLSVGINSLAAAGASIISPVLIGLGAVATIVGVGGASVVSRALGENQAEKASRTIANTFLIFWSVAITITVFGSIFIKPIVYLLEQPTPLHRMRLSMAGSSSWAPSPVPDTRRLSGQMAISRSRQPCGLSP